MDVERILARNLNSEVPAGVRPFLESDERALVIVRGIPGAIVATDRRVIVERTSTPDRPEIYPYGALTGVVGRLGLFGPRSVMLDGPGLRTNLDVLSIARSRNATVVAIWRLPRYRQTVAELNALIEARRPERPARAPRPAGKRGQPEAKTARPRTSRR